MSQWGYRRWCIWALIRQEVAQFSGQGVILDGEDMVIRHQLLTPPSRAASIRFDFDIIAGDDFVVVPFGVRLTGPLPSLDTLVLSLHRAGQALVPPGEHLQLHSQKPLSCTVEENLALALAAWQDSLPKKGWKRRVATWAVAPLWYTLCSRISKENDRAPAAVGWLIVRWTSAARDSPSV